MWRRKCSIAHTHTHWIQLHALNPKTVCSTKITVIHRALLNWPYKSTHFARNFLSRCPFFILLTLIPFSLSFICFFPRFLLLIWTRITFIFQIWFFVDSDLFFTLFIFSSVLLSSFIIRSVKWIECLMHCYIATLQLFNQKEWTESAEMWSERAGQRYWKIILNSSDFLFSFC